MHRRMVKCCYFGRGQGGAVKQKDAMKKRQNLLVLLVPFFHILFRVGKKKVRSLTCYCSVAYLTQSHLFQNAVD